MIIRSFGNAGDVGNSAADGSTARATMPPPAPAGSPIKNGNVEPGKGARIERLGEFNLKVVHRIEGYFPGKVFDLDRSLCHASIN